MLSAYLPNISVGKACQDSGGSNWSVITRAADEAIDKGVIVVAPVGKNGGLSEPGCGFNVITVGTVNDNNSPSRTSATLEPSGANNAFGPAWDGRIKPDVVAPGMGIMSPTSDTSLLYKAKSGASFASAMTTGAVAQLLQKNPSWNPAQMKAAIKQKAYLNSDLISYTENQRGKGIVDIAGSMTLTSSTINYALAYGLDVNSFIARDKDGSEIEYRFGKETAGSNIGAIFIHSGKLSNGGPLVKVFQKLSFSGIKVAGVTKTLTDNLLYAGPRIDYWNSEANAYVKYDVSGDKIQLW